MIMNNKFLRTQHSAVSQIVNRDIDHPSSCKFYFVHSGPLHFEKRFFIMSYVHSMPGKKLTFDHFFEIGIF